MSEGVNENLRLLVILPAEIDQPFYLLLSVSLVTKTTVAGEPPTTAKRETSLLRFRLVLVKRGRKQDIQFFSLSLPLALAGVITNKLHNLCHWVCW